MSGHSKWATIKRQKGANDMKRGQTFTKLSNAITIAVKQGGGIADPESNFRLRLAIDAARSANMPKENIERAIIKALGKDTGEMEEVVYEGFGPHGISVIVEAVTDNKQRTTPEIKNLFEKNGGTLGQPGSVTYLFQQVGQIIIKKNGKTLDEIMLLAADAGADDIEEGEDEYIIYTPFSELSTVKLKLSREFEVSEADLIRKPTITVKVNEKQLESIDTFLEKIENHQDVQKVYTNIEVEY